MKIVVILGVALVLYRLLRGRWPWDQARNAVQQRARAKARALLGLRAGASREQVIDAHRRLLGQVHPDRGGTNELVHEANAARDLLLGEIALGPADRP